MLKNLPWFFRFHVFNLKADDEEKKDEKNTERKKKENNGKENVVFLLFSSPSPLAQHNNKHTHTHNPTE
jgi:hypothetical protein